MHFALTDLTSVCLCLCVCVDSEEKTEQLMDSKHEAERLNQELQKLRQEVRRHGNSLGMGMHKEKNTQFLCY